MEDNWKRNRYIPEIALGAKIVNEVAEIDNDYQTSKECSDSISEFRGNVHTGQAKLNNIVNNNVCWNCGSDGHLFKLCTIPQRQIFCFKCGTPGSLTPNCQNCLLIKSRSLNSKREPGIPGSSKVPSSIPPRQTTNRQVAEIDSNQSLDPAKTL